MARGRKMSMGSIEEKIAKQKLQLAKSKEKYEADKGKLAELIKLRNELQTNEIVNALAGSKRSYTEIMAFIQGADMEERKCRNTQEF